MMIISLTVPIFSPFIFHTSKPIRFEMRPTSIGAASELLETPLSATCWMTSVFAPGSRLSAGVTVEGSVVVIVLLTAGEVVV